MNQIKRILFPIGVLVIGIIVIVVGFSEKSHAKTYTPVSAVVSQVDVTTTFDEDNTPTEEHTVYVKYTVNGKEYNEILSGSSNSMKEGDTLTVRYNPENPSEVTASTVKSATMLIVIGAIVCVIGLGSFVFMFIRRR